ncbi:hypothetical protein C0585_01815 [Candidatus Woesearchaeota archaeon]|nr:MAG: hypothetical protein C0585_01815 [Candidatus Woesearchaeota archaeon]
MYLGCLQNYFINKEDIMDYINELIRKDWKKEDKKFAIQLGIEVLKYLKEKVDNEEEEVNENDITNQKSSYELSNFNDLD